MKITPNMLSEVAPTLADLKRLPLAQKCRLLLARLAEIGKHHSTLNKHNLLMSGDPYGLAGGYSDAEELAVRKHLTGVPWTRLVNEGYLVDLAGQGFYNVTEDGKEYLDREASAQPSSLSGSILDPIATGAPRAFLSYSWDSPEHQRWVVKFAERLQGQSGVEIILDQWHLNPGDDKLHFMERAVAESDFVIMVCTPVYAQRANKREGGVGYESTVITAEMAEHILTNKFIPVLRGGAWTSSLPTYLKSKLGVNLADNPYREDEYEKLLRALHKEPVRPPLLGAKPQFSEKPVSNQSHADFIAAGAKDGNGRFRAPDQPLGLFWNAEGPGHEVFLAKGPAIWLRIMPRNAVSREWSHDELLKYGGGPEGPLQPLYWINFEYLRAEDGVGVYSTREKPRKETEADSVAFAFGTGEIWSVDTGLIRMSEPKHLHFLDIAIHIIRRFRGYGEFLHCLGIESPYKWIAGIEGVEGWGLTVPAPTGHVSTSYDEICLSSAVIATGAYTLGAPAAMTLRPFFSELFRKCGTAIPEHIEKIVRSWKS